MSIPRHRDGTPHVWVFVADYKRLGYRRYYCMWCLRYCNRYRKQAGEREAGGG